MSATAGALDGIRVLDLTRHIPGPYCTMLLGDLGADVVKVEEPPLGDPARATPPAVGDTGAAHAALNRNKRSIVVDLRAEGGAAVIRQLALRADVLVEGFRPGVLARHTLGPATLLAENLRLVYCSVTGYGQDGPLSSRAGHDIDYMARGGLLRANSDPDGRPILPATQFADMAGGLLGAIGILAALQARERTGRGQHVDVSMMHGILALMTVPASRRMAGGAMPNELMGTHACYNVYRCRDGRHLAVGALEPRFWESLCRALGFGDRVFRQWESGPGQRETLEAFVHRFAERDRDEWVRLLAAADACVEPVLDLDEAVAQSEVEGAVVELPAGGARFRTIASPVRLSATSATVRREAPTLGQHTGEVLAEAGYTRVDVEKLRRAGVLG